MTIARKKLNTNTYYASNPVSMSSVVYMPSTTPLLCFLLFGLCVLSQPRSAIPTQSEINKSDDFRGVYLAFFCFPGCRSDRVPYELSPNEAGRFEELLTWAN